MAYYDALIAKWATAPAGTTASKLVWINSQTVNGPAIPMIIPTHQIYNLIVRAEFDALATTQSQSVRDIIGMGTVDASPGTQIRSRVVSIFPSGTGTFTNLNNLAKNYDTPQVPWATAPLPTGGGLVAPVQPSDLTQAGLS